MDAHSSAAPLIGLDPTPVEEQEFSRESIESPLKRSATEDNPQNQVKKAPKKSVFQKSKDSPEPSAFYRQVNQVVLTPSASGLLDLVQMHVDAWDYTLKKAKIEPEDARSVLLRQLRECIEGHVTSVNRKTYPEYRYFTEAIEKEIPPILASVVGRLTPVKDEHRPDVVLDVKGFLVHFDRGCAARQWNMATWSDLAKYLTVMKKITGERHAQWILPLKGDGDRSLLTTGVCNINGEIRVISRDAGSRRKDLLAGVVALRKYDQVDGCYFLPRVLASEKAARAALMSYVMSSRPWTVDNFWREYFGPVIEGQKVISN